MFTYPGKALGNNNGKRLAQNKTYPHNAHTLPKLKMLNDFLIVPNSITPLIRSLRRTLVLLDQQSTIAIYHGVYINYKPCNILNSNLSFAHAYN